MRNPTYLKLLACAAIMATSVATYKQSEAATASVGATFTTSSAITVTQVSDIDFGTWFINVDQADGTVGDAIALTLNPTTGLVSTVITDGTDRGTTLEGTATEITASASVGEVTIQTPAAAAVDMFADITDFGGPALTMSAITYDFVKGGFSDTTGTLDTVASTNAETVTTTGGADDQLLLGATLTISEDVVDNTYTGASVLITVQY